MASLPLQYARLLGLTKGKRPRGPVSRGEMNQPISRDAARGATLGGKNLDGKQQLGGESVDHSLPLSPRCMDPKVAGVLVTEDQMSKLMRSSRTSTSGIASKAYHCGGHIVVDDGGAVAGKFGDKHELSSPLAYLREGFDGLHGEAKLFAQPEGSLSRRGLGLQWGPVGQQRLGSQQAEIDELADLSQPRKENHVKSLPLAGHLGIAVLGNAIRSAREYRWLRL
jgi:hypothetical protein